MAREMKNSGVRWIGEIPSNWSVKQVKYNFENHKYIPGIQSGLYERLALTLKGVVHRSKDDADGLQPKDFLTYQLLQKGELVFKLIDLQNVSTSRVGLSPYTGLVSPAYIILRANGEVIPEFAEKYFLMLWHRQIFNALGDDGIRSNLSANDLLNIPICYPSLAEQKAIADFLDAKCEDIDKLLADLDEEIKALAEYKKSIIAEVTTQGLNPNVAMKSSGVDWIGNIPAHWHIVPFRSYVVERAEKNLGGRNQNLLALSFALGVTRYADKKYNMDRVKDDFSGYQIVHKNDLVLSPNDIIKGSIFVSEHDGCISPMYKVFSNYDTSTYNLYYLSYHLRTKESGRKFFYIARGLIGEMLENGKYVTRRMTVARQDLLKFKVLLPPIEEQNEIVQYLDSKCAAIDQVITDKTQQIETLKAYKSSLIYEYVTGKKQVAI